MQENDRASQNQPLRCIAWLVISLFLISPATAQPPGDLTLQTFVTGLNDPTAMRHAGDGSGRLFITERAGVIRIWGGQGTSTLATPFLDISADVQTIGESGLLGLAFHPDYATKGFFCVSYISEGVSGDISVIERFTVSGNPDVADTASRSVILEIDQTYSNHNGGDIHFGPDGYLYIGFGDGGGFETPRIWRDSSARCCASTSILHPRKTRAGFAL